MQESSGIIFFFGVFFFDMDSPSSHRKRSEASGRSLPVTLRVQQASPEKAAVETATSVLSGGRKTPILPDKDVCHNLLFKVITFQGWLAKFQLDQVKADFLSGAFGVEENTPAMLKSIEVILEVMLPTPYREVHSKFPTALVGVDFFYRFLLRENCEPRDAQGKCFPVRKTFHDWAMYLGCLSASDYWSNTCQLSQSVRPKCSSPYSDMERVGGRISSDSRYHRSAGGEIYHLDPTGGDKTSRIKSKIVVDEVQSHTMGNHAFKPVDPNNQRRHFSDEGATFSLPVAAAARPVAQELPYVRFNEDYSLTSRLDKGEQAPPLSWKPPTLISNKFKKEMRDPDLRGHDLSEANGSTPDADDRRFDGSIEELIKQMRQPREAVAPEVFNGRDGTSLREFLYDFERYFSTKYEGSERQQSRFLGSFLGGSVKRVYDALEGSRCRYAFLKEQLLHWYRSERTNVRSRAESDFRKARMSSGDSFTIYAIRLERLAAKAFPDSLRERDRQLGRKFWKTVPGDFQRILSDGERSLALQGVHSKLDWASMLKLSETEDRHRRERRDELSTDTDTAGEDVSVWYSRTRAPPTSILKNVASERSPKVSFRHVHENKSFKRTSDDHSGSNSPENDDSLNYPLRPQPTNSTTVSYRNRRVGQGKGISGRSSESPDAGSSLAGGNSGRGRIYSRGSRPRRGPIKERRSSPVQLGSFDTEMPGYSTEFRSQGRNLFCNWCGRPGHVESTCWRKSGACMICGSQEHVRDGCPKFNSEWRGYSPTCARCGGPHLGMNCYDSSN